MTKQTEALKLALAALEVATTPLATDRQEVLRARAAIREALASGANEQPAQQQEPVGEVEQIEIDDDGQASAWFKLHDNVELGQLLYTSPQASKPEQQEIEELTTQRDKLADILTRTANALKGQPAELSAHSWHDLPEVAQQLKAAQQQQPVAWIYKPNMELLWPDEIEVKDPSKHRGYKPLYTSPQPAPVPEAHKQQEPWPEEPTGHIAGGVQPAQQLVDWPKPVLTRPFQSDFENGHDVGWNDCLEACKEASPQSAQELWPEEPAGHMAGRVQPAQHHCKFPLCHNEEYQQALAEQIKQELYTGEQPAQQQGPVAVVSGYYGGQCVVLPTNPAMLFNSGTAFYTSPPASKPLTDEQIKGIYEDCDAPTGGQFTLAFARAIEAAHGIKENT